ncbi:MAG: transposase [Alphaproteobacteria bacterium]|nr:transposase [Alphaproteobacteria bacterium]
MASVSLSIEGRIIYKGKSSRRLRREFQCQELSKRYWGQHLWARGYFVAPSEQVSAKEVQKCIDGQNVHHNQDNFRVFEF